VFYSFIIFGKCLLRPPRSSWSVSRFFLQFATQSFVQLCTRNNIAYWFVNLIAIGISKFIVCI